MNKVDIIKGHRRNWMRYLTAYKGGKALYNDAVANLDIGVKRIIKNLNLKDEDYKLIELDYGKLGNNGKVLWKHFSKV
jgi:S-adenosylmethionine synthetase